jgi:hypothetical protein
MVFTAYGIGQMRSAPVTTANVEIRLREWLEKFHMGIRLLPPDRLPFPVSFALEVTLLNDRVVIVSHQKEFSQYLMLQTNLGLSADTGKILSRLTPTQRSQVDSDLAIELSNLKVGYTMTTSPDVRVTLARMLPISPSLTEYDFISSIMDMDMAQVAAINTLATSMRRYQPQLQQLSQVGTTH